MSCKFHVKYTGSLLYLKIYEFLHSLVVPSFSNEEKKLVVLSLHKQLFSNGHCIRNNTASS